MTSALPESTRAHLAAVRAHYEAAPAELGWAAESYRAWLAHYYNLLIPAHASVLEVGCGSGGLLERLRAGRKVGLDLSPRQVDLARRRLSGATIHLGAGEEAPLEGPFDCIVVSDTLNYAADVQRLLERARTLAHADTRLILNFHSNLWRPALAVAGWLGLRAPHPQSSWLTPADVRNLLCLAGWQTVSTQQRILLPVPCLGLDRLLNRWLAPLPLFSALCLTNFCVARPEPTRAAADRTVSVIIPARNEAGNIEAAVRRTPVMGAGTELIFVEGHSRDETWAEIQRIARDHPSRNIRTMQQTGRGKGDAVRLGFAAATGDILMILDADLTMPPEELPKFYAIVADGRADFANGCRLVYPMEERAMQFLNLCANKAFGLIFSWLLGQPVKDTLCGTKALSRAHYERIAANRAHFGDFDPFGDFDLLFGAARLNLRIADVPIRYRDRTYGQTNIQRWRHGWLLLRMVLFAARKLKFV